MAYDFSDNDKNKKPLSLGLINSQKAFAVVLALLFEGGVVFFAFVSAAPDFSLVVKVAIIGIIFYMQYTAVYCVLLLFTCQLIADEAGITYREAFKVTFCSWEHFDRAHVDLLVFELISSNKAAITYPLFSKRYDNRRGVILIQHFVRR